MSYLPLAFVVRPLLRTRLFELIGGKPVTDNNRLINYASSVIESRTCNEKEDLKKGRGNQIDFLSHLVGHGDKKTGWQPTRTDLNTECLNMINAGADPYSSVAAGIIFYLLHNPDALRKATSEVRYVEIPRWFSAADKTGIPSTRLRKSSAAQNSILAHSCTPASKRHYEELPQSPAIFPELFSQVVWI